MCLCGGLWLDTEVVEGLEGEKQDFIRNAIFNGEPVKLLQDRSYMTAGRGSGDDGPVGVYGWEREGRRELQKSRRDVTRE